jgi:DNA-binding transcriptional ArsR family regulator
MARQSVTPEPAALKALSHPVRLRILGLLRLDGPATASSLATRLGMNSGLTSYHLRQLAQYGFVVEDVERGNRRDRWWKAAHRATSTGDSRTGTPEQREAHDAFGQAVAVVHTENLQRAIEERPLLPDEWRTASTLSDWELRLTPQQAAQLRDALVAVVEGWEEEQVDGAGHAFGTDRPELFTVVLHTYPYPGRVAPESSAEKPEDQAGKPGASIEIPGASAGTPGASAGQGDPS